MARGCWSVLAPEQFAAAVPVAGGENADAANCLRKLTIWAFHGGNDNIAPLDAGKSMVDAAQTAGNQMLG